MWQKKERQKKRTPLYDFIELCGEFFCNTRKDTSSLHQQPPAVSSPVASTPKLPFKKSYRRPSQTDLRVSPKASPQVAPAPEQLGLRRVSVSSNESGPKQSVVVPSPKAQKPIETSAVPPMSRVKQPEKVALPPKGIGFTPSFRSLGVFLPFSIFMI